MADATTPDVKSILESKTFWGIAIGFLAPFAAKHGWILDPSGWTTDITAMVGAVLALYGRFTASKAVTVK